ncbi:MAG: hypothetical protein KJ571_14655 [Bacteroidetes bacterium]|nr:hypothetical protein [Bacteroidota bacterium]
MDQKKKILQEKIAQTVQKYGCLLVDSVFRGSHSIPVLEIYIDNEQGVTIELCSEISREINEIIESAELLPANFRLDVSSPGVDRPLKFLIQYKKHLNRNFEVVYLIGEEKQIFNGKLKSINGEKLIFESPKSEIEIDFNSIQTAKVLISF